MILVDANLLVYARNRDSPHHDRARAWLDARVNDIERVGIPWPSFLAFVRLVSSPRVLEHPLPILEAWKQVEDWLSLDPVWIPEPTDRHREVLGRLLGEIGSRSKLVMDAHLAALAIEHGLTLCSNDADFTRFPGLRWENPLAPRRSA